MKYTYILLLFITLHGCDTKTQKTDEHLPTFTLTNEFQYNKPIRSYDALNGILTEWNGISFKLLPIKDTAGRSITCKYQLLGGTSYEKPTSKDLTFGRKSDDRWDLIRQVKCTFGILDTSNGLAWEKGYVTKEEILNLITMQFKLVPRTTVLTDSLFLEISELSNKAVALKLILHELRAQYDTTYNKSEGKLSLMKDAEELENTFYALSFDNQTIATIHFADIFSVITTEGGVNLPNYVTHCVGVTYQSYNDWCYLARLKLLAYTTLINKFESEHGL
jgi:hypothetical protein